MRTIAQTLKDEIHYPLRNGFIENKLLARGLDGEDEISAEIITGRQFIGAVADCLYSLVESVNFSESDISISLQDRNLILRKANCLYTSIGEEKKTLNEPNVYVGPPPGTYVSH